MREVVVDVDCARTRRGRHGHADVGHGRAKRAVYACVEEVGQAVAIGIGLALEAVEDAVAVRVGFGFKGEDVLLDEAVVLDG